VLLVSSGCTQRAGDGPVGAPAEPLTPSTTIGPTSTGSRTDPTTTVTPRASAGPCTGFDDGERTGTIAAPQLTELSGLAVSRRNTGLVWTHNDEPDDNRLFGIRLDGSLAVTVAVEGAEFDDWEDIAVTGTGPDGELWLGDIGDNNAARASIRVHRLTEPTVSDDAHEQQMTTQVEETVLLRYPVRPHDAEALVVDTAAQQIVIITKERDGSAAQVFTADLRSPDRPPLITMVSSSALDIAGLTSRRDTSNPSIFANLVNLVTAADIDPQGDQVLVRTYGHAWLWSRSHQDQTVADMLGQVPCEAPTVLEIQGEAIAFDPSSGGYLTVAEGENPSLHQFSPRPPSGDPAILPSGRPIDGPQPKMPAPS